MSGAITVGQSLSTTDLHAVPPATVVRAADGTIACRHWDGEHGVVFGDGRPFPWEVLSGPALVLWVDDAGVSS